MCYAKLILLLYSFNLLKMIASYRFRKYLSYLLGKPVTPNFSIFTGKILLSHLYGCLAV